MDVRGGVSTMRACSAHNPLGRLPELDGDGRWMAAISVYPVSVVLFRHLLTLFCLPFPLLNLAVPADRPTVVPLQHGDACPRLRPPRQATQPSGPRRYLLPQAQQDGPARQPPDQAILLRRARPQCQAPPLHQGNEDRHQVRRCRCRGEEVRSRPYQVLSLSVLLLFGFCR